MPAPARIPVAVAGAAGRLGSAVVRHLAEDPRFVVAACLDRPGSGRIGSPIVSDICGVPALSEDAGSWQDARLLLDASRAESVTNHVERAAESGVGMIIAVTALPADAERSIDRAADRIPILVAPNLSFGAAVLARLAREAARLWPDAQAAIVEAHHAQKRDRPSGTARWLERNLIAGWGESPSNRSTSGASPEVQIHSVRVGTVVGDHRVWLAGVGERLELAHVAESRDSFAVGAVRALFWLASAKPGRYTMEDLTGA